MPRGAPCSFTVHEPEEADRPVFLELGEKIRRSAFVVAISSYGGSQLYGWVHHEEWPNVKLVHCGLAQVFHQVDPVPIPQTPRLVCVGRLCEQKGQLLLIEAGSLLNRKGIVFHLVLAGDGEMRGEIERLIGCYGLSSRVQITGWISGERVREEILSARALDLPSFAEGLPVVIVEPMTLRRPVLSTYVAGIPELVRPGENGWLFPAGGVEDLAAAMNDCLTTPTEILQRMGEAAHLRVVRRHDINIEAAKLARLFREGEHVPA